MGGGGWWWWWAVCVCVCVCWGVGGTRKMDRRWRTFLPRECQSKQPISRLNSADQHQHIVSSKGGMEVMMMVMRITMMMALLCFTLTLLPWGIFFFFFSFFLVLLSIIHSTVLRRPESAATLQRPTAEPENVQFTLCPALQWSRACNNCVVFSLFNTQPAPRVNCNPSLLTLNLSCTCYLKSSSSDTYFWASLCSTAHTKLFREVIWITRTNHEKKKNPCNPSLLSAFNLLSFSPRSLS